MKGWTKEEMQNLNKGIVKFPVGTVNRWRVIADFVGSKSQKEVISKAKEIQERQQRDVEAKREEERLKKERKAQLEKEAQAKVKRELEEQKTGDGWSAAQQKQLEKGMREVPTTLATKERWLKVADLVDGKSAKECFGRYKELCASAKAKASAQK
mmetsp:Transcript_10645/g.16233  ORF Transcript_10645/g.16233 Transcript_10645/m.16233 type:complete len:155 (+) Transcript_10645:1394-1858(+)